MCRGHRRRSCRAEVMGGEEGNWDEVPAHTVWADNTNLPADMGMPRYCTDGGAAPGAGRAL